MDYLICLLTSLYLQIRETAMNDVQITKDPRTDPDPQQFLGKSVLKIFFLLAGRI